MSIYPNIWGIFDVNNDPVFEVDNMMDLGYTNASKVSTFPVEKGSFASYNKVRSPFKAKVRASVGGDQDRIAAFIIALDTVANDVNLYNIVTPEHTYLNANIEKISYKRSAKDGANLIMGDMELIEIRQVSAQYGNTSLAGTVTKNAKHPTDWPMQRTGLNQTAAAPVDLADLNLDQVIAKAHHDAPGGH